MKPNLVAVVVAMLAVSACNTSHEISVEGYDRTCTTHEDCVRVYVGDVCDNTGCSCPGAFINAREKERYDREYDERGADCPPSRPFHAQCDACPAIPACQAGTCGYVSDYSLLLDAGNPGLDGGG